jgi:hypothetical protein
MLLSARAWHLRQTAKAAFAASNPERALEAAAAAEQMQHTQSGAFLQALAAWLARDELM